MHTMRTYQTKTAKYKINNFSLQQKGTSKQKFISYFPHPVIATNTKTGKCLWQICKALFLRHFLLLCWGPIVLPTPLTSVEKYGEIATPDTPLALSMLANIMCYKNSAYMWYSPL